MTSAKKNGRSPKAKARCQLCVIAASQTIPAPNRTISATIPATRLRAKEATPCSASHPAIKATTGYAMRYPPVGPNSCATPPTPTGLKTGNPIAPQARYRAAAANPRLLPSAKPTSNTPKFPNVRGTGVNGRGNTSRAHTAITALAQTTIPACFAKLNHCSATFSVWVRTSVCAISLPSVRRPLQCRVMMPYPRQQPSQFSRQLHRLRNVFSNPCAPASNAASLAAGGRCRPPQALQCTAPGAQTEP